MNVQDIKIKRETQNFILVKTEKNFSLCVHGKLTTFYYYLVVQHTIMIDSDFKELIKTVFQISQIRKNVTS